MSSSPAAEAAVTYREQAPPPGLAPWVRCLRELTVQGDGGPGRVVPDALWGRATAECTRLAGRSPATLVAGLPAAQVRGSDA